MDTVRIIFGIILGIILTIGCAYAYDSMTGRAGNGLSAADAGGRAPMVNWNIVSNDWQNLQSAVRNQAEHIQHRLKEHS